LWRSIASPISQNIGGHSPTNMAQRSALHMWTSAVERVAKKAGGHLDGGVSVEASAL
jgi:hypothetical protein